MRPHQNKYTYDGINRKDPFENLDGTLNFKVGYQGMEGRGEFPVSYDKMSGLTDDSKQTIRRYYPNKTANQIELIAREIQENLERY